MTSHKHTSHWDSELSRSLEKVALEKGLIKPEVLQKQASPNLDLSPSSDLMENIFKLCSGLRSEGLIKEANEVETYYLKYKKAQTLYETHQETGDDVVHSAHPKGSHHLVDVDGEEATVEDILDKHDKIVKMIEKTPTGKLSSAHQVLRAVKIALADNSPQSQLRTYVHAIINILNHVLADTSGELSISIDSNISSIISLLNTGTTYSLNNAKEELKRLYDRLKPPFIMGIGGFLGLSEETWKFEGPKLLKALGYLTSAIALSNQIDRARNESEEKTEIVPSDATTEVFSELPTGRIGVELAKIPALKAQITAWKSNPKFAANAEAVEWVNKTLVYLDGLTAQYQNTPSEQVNKKLPALQQAIAEATQTINGIQPGIK